MGFADLIREGAERGLIAYPERWLSYRYQRNLTSHTYDEEKAKAVHATALEFLADGRALLAALSARGNHGPSS